MATQMTKTFANRFKYCALLALAGLALAGCSTTSSDERIGSMLSVGGKYDLYDCVQLARQATGVTFRIKDLNRLMERAKQGPGGGFVSAVAYEPEYYAAVGDLRVIRNTQAEMRCSAPVTPAPARRPETIKR